jgi:hypothetical protein
MKYNMKNIRLEVLNINDNNVDDEIIIIIMIINK